MTYSSIEGKFYPLQNEEFLLSRKELTTAQRDVLYHLKTLNPFGDHFKNISIKEVAKQLDFSRRTVFDALKLLYQRGWIDLELIAAEVRICPCKCNNFNKLVAEFLSMEKQQQVVEKQQQNSDPEPLPGKGSGSPHTIKTNISLSISDKKEEIGERNF